MYSIGMDSAKELGGRERVWIAALLAMLALVVAWDLVGDFQSGSSWSHLLLESFLTLAALSGAIAVLARFWRLKQENVSLRFDMERIRESEQKWKAESARHVQGLSRAIDDQFNRWGLTPAEKEVALLLLKGLSLKEAAEVRSSSERTVRQHSLMIYQKSGLSGRAELSAFFLEDLLAPKPLDQELGATS